MTEGERLSEAGEAGVLRCLASFRASWRGCGTPARRRVVGGTGGALALVGACVAIVMWFTGTPAPVSAPPGQPPIAANPTPDRTIDEPTPGASSISIAWVQTDPGVADRLEARPVMSGFQVLSDDELLHDLRAAGHDCGLIKMEGRAWLSCDTPLAPPAHGG